MTPGANLNTGVDTDGDGTDGPIGEKHFVIAIPVANANITLPADSTASPAVATRMGDIAAADTAIPNLKDLFEFGGTIELLLGALDATEDDDKQHLQIIGSLSLKLCGDLRWVQRLRIRIIFSGLNLQRW